MLTQQTENGVGVVGINGANFWGLWVYDYAAETCEPTPSNRRSQPHRDQQWRIRLSIDDFESLDIHEYERVRIRLPRYDPTEAYFKLRRTNPPFVWLQFGVDVRR